MLLYFDPPEINSHFLCPSTVKILHSLFVYCLCSCLHVSFGKSCNIYLKREASSLWRRGRHFNLEKKTLVDEILWQTIKKFLLNVCCCCARRCSERILKLATTTTMPKARWQLGRMAREEVKEVGVKVCDGAEPNETLLLRAVRYDKQYKSQTFTTFSHSLSPSERRSFLPKKKFHNSSRVKTSFSHSRFMCSLACLPYSEVSEENTSNFHPVLDMCFRYFSFTFAPAHNSQTILEHLFCAPISIHQLNKNNILFFCVRKKKIMQFSRLNDSETQFWILFFFWTTNFPMYF